MKDKPERLIVGKHYPALDGLRGLAVILVLWFHSLTMVIGEYGQDMTLAARKYFSFANMGNTGVDLFFIISGFLITCILIDTADKKNCLKKFYIRRALRIFPLYYVSLIILFFFIFIQSGGDGFATHLISHMFFIQNWGISMSSIDFAAINHFWSLAVEEQFYLFWPLIFMTFRNQPKALMALCIVIIILASIFNTYFWDSGWSVYSYTNTLSRMDALSIGTLLAIAVSYINDHGTESQITYIKKYAKVALGVCTAYLIFDISSTDYYYEHALQRRNHHLLLVLYASLLLLIFYSKDKGAFSTLFSSKLLMSAGRVSYGFYIIHWPVMLLLSHYLLKAGVEFWFAHVMLFFVTGAVTYLLSSLSYRYFEKPILNLKDKYAHHEG